MRRCLTAALALGLLAATPAVSLDDPQQLVRRIANVRPGDWDLRKALELPATPVRC